MKRLKDITPGDYIYTIMVEYYASGKFKKVTVLSRIVTSANIIKGEDILKIRTKHTEATRFYGTNLSFYLFCLDKKSIKVHRMGYDFIYAFSEGAFIEELQQLLSQVKKTISKGQKHIAIEQFYYKFMPNVIRMIHSHKSECVIINIK